MIRTFADKDTKAVFERKPSRRFHAIQSSAQRRLDHIHAATSLHDLGAIPGNRLEAPKRNLKGFHAIRISDKWRVVFRWVDGAAEDVRITDYH